MATRKKVTKTFWNNKKKTQTFFTRQDKKTDKIFTEKKNTFHAIINNGKRFIYECPCGKRTIFSKWMQEHIKKAKQEERRRLYIELTDCWSKCIKDYDNHICNNQDGDDISFTKKTLEQLFQVEHKGAVLLDK